MNAETTPRYLTLTEAAARAGVSIVTLRRRIKDGSIPHVMLVGRFRIREDHLAAWIEGRL